MDENNFQIMLQAVLDKIKSIANIKENIKAIESKLPKIKLQGTLNSTTTKKELNSKLKSINPKVKIDADTTQVEKKIRKINQQKTSPTITPTVDNSQVIFGLKQAQRETKTLWDRFTNGMMGINLIRMGVQEVVRAIRQAIVGIKELDAIKTNIQMVSGTSDSGVNVMMSSYNTMAKELSSTTKNVAEAANEFLRMGESIENTNELIRSSQVLSQVGMIESSEAASYLISSLKGYQVAAKDSMDIVSKLTSVDLEAAVSAGGLAEALSKCANIANNSGIAMDRLIGYTATIGETTQKSMSEVGNSIQSLLSRMNNIKIGRFIDDETGESLSDTEAVLNKLGIQLRDTEDSYRSFDDVLDDVGKHWDTFNKVEQNAISVAIAGTRQRENFEALMNNYGNALKYAETAANSAGSALERYGVYQDSIQAKTNELTAAIESLSTNVISEDLYSGIIEATTGVVEFIDKANLLKGTLAGLVTMGISKAFVSMATGIITATKSTAQLTATMALFDNGRSVSNLKAIGAACKGLSDQQLKLVLSTKGLTNSQRLQVLAGMGVAESERQQTLATLGFASAENASTVSTFSFKGALNALKTTIISSPIAAIATAVSAVTIAFSMFKQKQEEAKQAIQEAKQEYQKLTFEIDSLNEELETTQERLKELNAIGYNNLSLVEQEEYDRLKATNEELERELRIKEALSNVKAREVADNARNTLSKHTQTSIEKVEYGAEGVALETTVDIVESVNEYINLAEKQRQSLEETKQALGDYENAYAGTAEEMVKDKSWQKLNDNVEKAENALSDTEKIISEKYESIEEEAEGLVNSFGNVVSGCEEMYQRVEDLKNRTDEYFNLAADIQDEVKEIDSELEVPEIRITFDQAWADSFASESDAIKELGNSLLDLAEKGRLTKEIFNEVDSNAGDYFKNLGISADEAVSKINKLVDESKQLSSMSDQISSIVDALSTKLSDGFVSADTLSGFDIEVRELESWDRFQEVLGSTASSYEECQEAANALATEWVNSSDFLAQLTEQNKEYYETQLQAMGVENYEEVIAYAQQLNVAKEALTQASFDVATATAEEIQAFINEGAYSELAQQQIWNLVLAKQTEEGITLDTSADCQNLLALAQNAGVTGDAIELLTSLLEIYNNLAAGTYGTNAQVINAVKNQANALKAQIDGIFANGVKGNTTEIDNMIKVSPATKSSAKSAGKETGKSYKEGLEEELSNLDSVISGVTKKIDKQISSIKSQKEEAVAAIDAQIDALNDQKSALQAQKKALEEERDARIEIIEQQKKQLELAIKSIDKQIKAKEKIIKSINDEIKAMKDANEQRKLQLNLQKEQYELERLQHQRTILIYSEEKGMHYVTDTKGIRDQKQKVDDARLEIEIANKQKQIDLIEKEIDLLEEKKEAINEQIELLDEQIEQIKEFYDEQIKAIDKQIDAIDKQIEALEKQKEQTEKYFESLIENLEKSKSKYEELTELVGEAELSAALKKLGIDEEALLNGSEEEFQKLKNAYLDIVFQLNAGNDEVLSALQELSGYDGTAPAMLSDSNTELDTMNTELDTANQSIDSANSSLGETSPTTSEVASNVDDITTNLTEANTLVTEEQTAFDNLKQKIDEVIEAINLKTEAIQKEQEAVGITTSSEMADFLLLKEKILEVKETLESFGSPEEGLIHNIATAIESLNEISLEDGIIGQFAQLKEAVEAVASAISGGGESSGGESQGGNSGSSGSESGGNGSNGEGGGGNSLTGAIEQMGETAQEVIGEPDAEGDGTVIGEFGSLETAVNDVTTAIGGGDSEGGGDSGGEDDSNLIGSIVELGETTEETLGEPDGDGVIARFGEFKDVIAEAANQVKSISKGLDEIDGKEVECTITINVKMNGSIPAFASGTVLGNMQIESASYNAKYGKAFASGTIGLPHAEKNALVSEYGQTEMTVLPDGKTIITDTPTLMDLPKDTVIYNEEETKKIMDNKVNASGNVHAKGTDFTPISLEKYIRELQQKYPTPGRTMPQADDGSWIGTDGHKYRYPQPGERAYELQKAFEPLLNKWLSGEEEILSNAMFEGQKQMEKWTKQVETINNITNNKNIQQPVVNNINVTCPGVTEQQVAQQLGSVISKELDKQFSGFHNYVDQQSRIR